MRVAAVKGTVFYDGQCGFCSRWAAFWSPTLQRNGFDIAPLDEIPDQAATEPRDVGKLATPRTELLTDIGLITADGRLISGADVYLYAARRIRWAWPLYAVFSLPGLNGLLHAGYRWFARNRYSISRSCELPPQPRVLPAKKPSADRS